jgi:hypothetical protein
MQILVDRIPAGEKRARSSDLIANFELPDVSLGKRGFQMSHIVISCASIQPLSDAA